MGKLNFIEFVSLVTVWMKWFAGGDQRNGRMVGGKDNPLWVPNMFIIKIPNITTLENAPFNRSTKVTKQGLGLLTSLPK